MRIPTGNFGNAVAAPQQQARVSPDAAAATGDAINRAGRVGMQVAGGLLAQQEAEAKQAEDDMQRARTIRVMAETKNGLFGVEDEISRGVAAGEINTADADKMWGDQSSKLLSSQLEQVDPSRRDLVSAQLLDTQAVLRSKVRDTVTKRNQQQVGAELIGTREQLQRGATRDRAGAAGLWDQTVDSLGPLAGMDPKAIAVAKQQFRESAAETAAYSLITESRNDVAGITAAEQRINSDEFADLDPQKRAVLNNTALGYKTSLEQKAVMAAQRAEIAADRRERKAASAFDAVWKLATDGKLIDPVFAAKASREMEGTTYAAALPQVLSQAKEGTAFAMQPVAAQRAIVDRMAAEGNAKGWTPQSQERYNRLDAARKASEQDYQDDALRAGLDRGVIREITPVSLSSVDSIAQTIGARLDQAQQVAVVAGRPVSPFTKDEARSVGDFLNALPIKQRTGAIAEISKTIGAPAAAALAQQIDQKDRPLALAMGFGRQQTTAGRYTSELILAGNQAIKDKVVKVDAAAEQGWRASIAAQVRGVYSNPDMENAVIDSAYYIQAGLAAEGNDDVSQAVRLAASGRIVERNGVRIPLPAGWGERQFRDTIRTFPAASIAPQTPDGKVYVGRTPVPVDEFVAKLPGATLRHAGQGRYAVSAGGGLVTNADGAPVIIDVLKGGIANAR